MEQPGQQPAPPGTAATPTDRRQDAHVPLLDWSRTARRLRRILIAIAALVAVAWLGHGALSGGLAPRVLGELVGLGLLLAFVVEVVVVGGSAVRGMLAAGERGERLAGSDVGLLPPQLGRRRRR